MCRRSWNERHRAARLVAPQACSAAGRSCGEATLPQDGGLSALAFALRTAGGHRPCGRCWGARPSAAPRLRLPNLGDQAPRVK